MESNTYESSGHLPTEHFADALHSFARLCYYLITVRIGMRLNRVRYEGCGDWVRVRVRVRLVLGLDLGL